MALVKCKECGSDVSNKAKACPKCGAKLPARWSVMKVVVSLFFVMIAIFTVQASLDGDKKEAAESERRAALTPEQRQVEDVTRQLVKDRGTAQMWCQEAVRKSLHDPASAELGDSRGYFAEIKQGTWSVRVTGKAKNGFNALRQMEVGCRIKHENGEWSVVQLTQE